MPGNGDRDEAPKYLVMSQCSLQSSEVGIIISVCPSADDTKVLKVKHIAEVK